MIDCAPMFCFSFACHLVALILSSPRTPAAGRAFANHYELAAHLLSGLPGFAESATLRIGD